MESKKDIHLDFFNVLNNLESALQKSDIQHSKDINILADQISKFRYNCKCVEDLVNYIEKSFNHKLRTLESKCDKLVSVQNKKINTNLEQIVKNKLETTSVKFELMNIKNNMEFQYLLMCFFQCFILTLFIIYVNI
jgi:hypothetical protein